MGCSAIADFYVNQCADLKNEGLVEDRVQGFAMNFGLHLLLLVRHDVDFDVRIRCSTHVHCRQLGCLDHAYGQLQHQTKKL